MVQIKKIINVFLISITIFVGVFIILIFSQSNYSNKYNIYSENQQIGQSKNFIETNNVSTTYALQSSSISYYCSKDTNVIITEDQGREGLCWDFSTLKSLEILYSVKYHEVFDFSEAWIALCSRMEDSSYIIGDGESDIVKNSFWSSTKISFQQNILSIIDKYGIVMESDMPYEVIYHIDDTNYKDYYNLYSQYNVKLPYPAKVTSAFANYNESTSWERLWGTYNKQGRMNNIKDFIVNNGSVMARVNMPKEPKLINNKVVVYESNNSNYSNHAIAIIGWDDNFLYSTNGSNISGAWIALNSYGSDFGEDGLFYIMYDDMIVCDNIYGFEISDDSRNLNITNIVSTATFNNKESNVMNSSGYVKNSSCNVTNIFKPRSNKQVVYFYQSNQNYSNYSLQIKVEFNHQLIDEFTVQSSPFEIKNSVLTNYGSYSIIFEYDKESDGVIDEKYCHQITIWTGIDFGSVVTNLLENNNDRYYQLYSNYHNKENQIFVYTYQDLASISIYFNSYSNLISVDCDITKIGYRKDDMTYSSDNSYAYGRYNLIFNNISTKGKKYDYSIRFISIDGITETYNIIVFRMMDNQTIAYLDYCDTDVRISELNYKILPVSQYENIKVCYNYKDGYYMNYLKDSNDNCYYGNMEDGYTIYVSKMNKTNCEKNYYNYSNYTNSYFYTCILYSNFVIDDFKYDDNKQITTLYGWESEHDIPTASGGSGSFSYSLVEPVEKGVKLLNNKKIQFSALKVGIFIVNICAKDIIRKQCKYCYIMFSVSPRLIQIYIDNKNSCYGDDIKKLTYSIISQDIIKNDRVSINLKTTATKTSPVGLYKITADTDNVNYKVEYNEANYTIQKRMISLKNDYYELEYTGYSRYPNLQFNNAIGDVEYNLTKQMEIGTYQETIELLGDSAKNYTLDNNIVNFSIIKATPKYVIPFFENITLDNYKTLNDIVLSENYTWETPSQTLHYGLNSCVIIYTPSDLEHYNITTFVTTIYIEKPISGFLVISWITVITAAAVVIAVSITIKMKNLKKKK